MARGESTRQKSESRLRAQPTRAINTYEKTDASYSAEADRESAIASAKARIASSDTTIKAGRQAAKAAVEADPEANDAKLVAEEKRAADTARYEALAEEHGADLREDGFNDALRKLTRAATKVC